MEPPAFTAGHKIAVTLTRFHRRAQEGDRGTGGAAEQTRRVIEIQPKPVTQKWSGRIHFDYWGIPDGSPLTNFLETGDPDEGPGDFIGFRRLRLGVKGDIYETMLYKIEMDFAEPRESRVQGRLPGLE